MSADADRAGEGATLAGGSDIAGVDGRLSMLRRIRRNFGIVFGGNLAAAALGLITLALNARALGAAGIGVLALVMAIAMTIDRIFAFESWQPLVKLGSQALQAGDRGRFSRVIMVALLFDVASAVAASCTAVLVLLMAGEKFGIPREYFGETITYLATLGMRIVDAPAGVLRTLDRFWIITVIRTGEATAICAAAAGLFFLDAPITTYILAYAAIAVAANLVMLGAGLLAGMRAGAVLRIGDIASAWSGESREFWSYSWVLSLAGTSHVIRQNGALLLISVLVGPSAAGVYHLAERMSGVISMAMWAVHQTLYTETAHLIANSRYADLSYFVVRVGLLCILAVFVAILGIASCGHLALSLLGGPGYQDAFWPLVLLTISYLFPMAGVGLRSAVIIGAGPKYILRGNLISLMAFAMLSPLLILNFGIMGAAAGQIIFEAVWLAVLASAYAMWMGLNRGENEFRTGRL